MDLIEGRNTIPERRRLVRRSVRTNDYFPFTGGLNLVDPPLVVQHVAHQPDILDPEMQHQAGS